MEEDELVSPSSFCTDVLITKQNNWINMDNLTLFRHSFIIRNGCSRQWIEK